RLAQNEDRFQAVTLKLMLEVSGMNDFSNLRNQVDREDLEARARSAVAELQKWTAQYGELAEAQEQLRTTQEAEAARAERRRTLVRVLEDLEQRFLAMHSETDHRRRGHNFEGMLNELFFLFDLN